MFTYIRCKKRLAVNMSLLTYVFCKRGKVNVNIVVFVGQLTCVAGENQRVAGIFRVPLDSVLTVVVIKQQWIFTLKQISQNRFY